MVQSRVHIQHEASYPHFFSVSVSSKKFKPMNAGAERCLCSSEGGLPFRRHIENWMRGVRTKLMQWSMRLLKEEVWQHPAGSMGGLTNLTPSHDLAVVECH